MIRNLSFLAAFLAVLGLAAVDGSALAQPKDKDKEKKVKQHKHHNAKDLVGDKVKKDGRHKFHAHGKHTAFVNVKGGKITGVNVTHAEKGKVPVTKYKSKKKMAEAPAGGMQTVSLIPVQLEYLGVTWIGYAYIDDWGDEIIYWFPYDMVYDADTGAIEYIPA